MLNDVMLLSILYLEITIVIVFIICKASSNTCLLEATVKPDTMVLFDTKYELYTYNENTIK